MVNSKYPIIYKVSYMSGGAGFFPPTASLVEDHCMTRDSIPSKHHNFENP